MRYCPIARHFYRIRRVLIEELGLPRQAIRPSATFADLVPREHRRRVWGRFRGEKMKVNALEISLFQFGLIFASMIGSGLLILALLPHSLFCVATAIVAGIVAFLALAPRVTHIDPSYTIGDAAVEMTTVRECQEAGYRLTRNEIFLKVRCTLAEACNISYAEIKPESKLMDLVGD